MKKVIIGEGGARIICDAFFDDMVNPKRLHKEGYRLYLWQQWCRLWRKEFQVVYKDKNGVLVDESKSYIGTREEFEELLRDLMLPKNDD